MSEHDDIPVEQLKDLLSMMTDWLPNLINELRSTIFSAEAGKELGRAVGAFYKELVESGIPVDDALEMAKSYIGSLQSVMEHVKWSGGKES